MTLDVTENFELPLPHPDNSPRTVDVPRLRAALAAIDTLLKELQLEDGSIHEAIAALDDAKADKSQVTIDIANAVSAAVSDLLAGAPEAYDTLKEIADKLADNDDVAGNILLLISALQIGKADLVSGKVPLTQLSISSDEDAEAGTGTGLMDATKTAKAIAAQALNTLPVGTIIQSAEHPGDGWLALDGSKYLRSAYPEIEGLFGLPLAPVGNPNNVTTSKSQAVVVGDYIVALSDGKIYRAPISATSDAEFVEVYTMPGSASYYNLVKTKEGVLYALRSQNDQWSYLVRSLDEGVTWQTVTSFLPTSYFSVSGYFEVFDVDDYTVVCNQNGIFRVAGGAMATSPIGQGYSPHIEVDGLIYYVSSNAVRVYDPATNALNSGLSMPIPAGADTARAFVHRGKVAVACPQGQNLSAFYVSTSGRADQFLNIHLPRPNGYDLGTFQWVGGQDKGDIVEVMYSTASGSSQAIMYSIGGGGSVLSSLHFGVGAPTQYRKPTRSGNILILPVNNLWTAAKVVLDGNPDTEFRLPDKPFHYIKTEAA